MAEVVVTRKFRLDNLQDLQFSNNFPLFQDLVNDQICQGLRLPFNEFENISLIAVKRFYKNIQNCNCALRERIHRCGAQYSYFALQEYRRNQKNLIEIIKVLHRKGFFNDNSNEILKNTDLSVFEIDNKQSFIKNLMLKEFDHIDLSIFHHDLNEHEKYQQLVNNTLKNKDFLKKILRSFNQKAGRTINKRFRELHGDSYSNTSNYDGIILRILDLNNINEVSKILTQQWDSAKRKYRTQLKNSLFSLPITINNWGSIDDEKFLLLRLLKGGKSKKWVNGASSEELMKFVQREFDELLLEQMNEFYKIQFLPEINNFLSKLLRDLNTQVPNYLKTPVFTKSSIPLGMDDGQAYLLQEQYTSGNLTSVDMKISMRTGNSQIAKIRNINRYKSMKENGYSTQRGVLSFSRGKYFIFIPFKKKACEKRDGDLIASADLGLKTFATLSVFKKSKEIDRKFLDQKYLGGKKDNWFTNGKPLNLKSKLIQHRYIARKQQSLRMGSRNRSVKHWYTRNIEKRKWRKINNTHTELVHQIATRIIAYLNRHQVSTLVLENLKWSRCGSRAQVGYFLSTWQIHWFFSQVQKQLMNMALLYGIHVELVNPRNSSKTCWKCGEFGNRFGKQFVCSSKSCLSYQVDSDLNAARNLILRSKRYKRLIRRL